ncbi:hypothetical protein [Bacillus cereus group sp. BfR-BA-01309]|uniref:hypothetical protein n=1 Tax=Bacillus cereus group sp. BfR-BA-01309 TaxID=2920286 RepID=UPI001F55ECD9|nr:hypothetical protein [Bacillus cereus group sp. BfR-BA-01309]
MGWVILTNYASRSESFLVQETHKYLVDAGRTKKGERVILKYRWLFKHLDCFVITHGDEDHIELANFVIENLEPKIIIISPLVYVLEKFRFNFTPSRCRISSLFGRDYNIVEVPEFNGFDNFTVYAIRRRTKSNPLPWQLNFRNGLMEFQSFPTSSVIMSFRLINDFIERVKCYPKGSRKWLDSINEHQLISDLRMGGVLNKEKYKINKLDYLTMWKEIENAIIKKKIKNEMSLICRIGSTFFTGDASKKQLIELKRELVNQSNLLNNDISIKINHHASYQSKYKYIDFYNRMKPKQLILKRDYQIQGKPIKPMFIKYLMQLNGTIQTGGVFYDSNDLDITSDSLGIFKTF